MAAKTSPEDKLVTAALAAIEEQGWAALSLTAMARKAKIPPQTMYEMCPDKRALLSLMAKRTDIALLERADEPDKGSPARDRAFDAILNWFEGLAPMRPALRIIHNESVGNLGEIIDLIPATMRSAQWIADCAALPSTGWEGFFVTRAIGLLLAETLGVWLNDGDDLAKTMAHVDRRMRTMEEWVSALRQANKSEKTADTD
jgi:AcrR family transcriptional regulator